MIPFQPWRFSSRSSLTHASDFQRHLLTSLAAEANGAELVGPTLQPDLREFGLTSEAILTDVQTTPEIDARFKSRDERQVDTDSLGERLSVSPPWIPP